MKMFYRLLRFCQLQYERLALSGKVIVKLIISGKQFNYTADGSGPSRPSVLSDDQLTGATAIQLRGSLKKLQNPKIDLLKLSGSSSSKVIKRHMVVPPRSLHK